MRTTSDLPSRRLRRPPALPRLFLCVLILSIGVACASQAAESGGEDAERLRAEADRLLEEIGESRAQLAELDQEIGGTAGEGREALERRRIDRRKEILTDVHTLADRVLELERTGGDASALRAAVGTLLQQIPPAIRRLVAETERRVDALNEERRLAAPEARPELDDRIARQRDRLDDMYQAMHANMLQQESLGLPAIAEREFLRNRLVDRAEELVGRLEIAAEQRKSLEARRKDAPEDADLQLRLSSVEARLQQAAGHLQATLDLMDPLEIETATYRQKLISTTGELSSDILDRKVAVGVFSEWWREIRLDGMRQASGLLFKAILFVAILATFRLLAFLARRIVARSLASAGSKFSRLMSEMILSMTTRTVMVLGVLVALSQLGISVGPFLAGLGIAGFIVGFALQDTLSNFAAGMMILFYRPFDVDDLVAAGGVEGKVRQMNLVATTIVTLDNQTLVVPNSKIWGDVIKNVTSQRHRRVDLVFGIAYGDDIEKAERVLNGILADHDKVLDDPAPIVRLHKLGDSSVDFVVRPWVLSADYWEVYWDVTREVKVRFDREGISIPFPQRDVHLFENRDATSSS